MQLPEFLKIPIVVYVISCLVHMIEGKVRTGKWDTQLFNNPGNSTMVTASIVTTVGLQWGFDSMAFAIASVFGLMMIIAMLFRTQLNEQAKVLNRLQKEKQFFIGPEYPLSRLFIDLTVGALLTILLFALSNRILG